LSKAPVPSALLKTRRIVVNYSHNGWTNIRGQVMHTRTGLVERVHRLKYFFREVQEWQRRRLKRKPRSRTAYSPEIV
jgi:hypothetical protein